MTQTRISALDAWLGGALPGRIHLLTGGPGSGKSSACLYFLGSVLNAHHRAVLVTQDRSSDLQSHAAYLGIDLGAPLREKRLVIVRYRAGFGNRLSDSAWPGAAVTDLAAMLAVEPTTRVIVDPVTPFLADATGASLAALVDWLDESGATSLLTWNGEPLAGRDRRMESLLERAAMIVRFRHEGGTRFQAEVIRARHTVASDRPLTFDLRPSGGIVSHEPKPGTSVERHSPSRRLLLMYEENMPSKELVALLQHDYEPSMRRLEDGVGDVDAANWAAVLVETSPASIDAAGAVVDELAARAFPPALIVSARFNLRSMDRARLLRRGADEVLATDMSGSEFLERLAAVVHRGHSPPPRAPVKELVITQPTAAGGHAGLLDGVGFAQAVRAHAAGDPRMQYAIVSLAPASVDAGEAHAAPPGEPALHALADTVLRCMRVASGDLVAVTDGRVMVYLHGTGHDHAMPFVERLRARWTKRSGTANRLRIDVREFPSGDTHPTVGQDVPQP